MTGKSNIHLKRLVTSGLLAGIFVDLITGFANSSVLKDELQAWASGMGDQIHPPSQQMQICLWLLMGLIDGFVGVWIYAAMRPSYGAGPKTALLAGSFV